MSQPDSYFEAIAGMPCMVCGTSPVQVHHAQSGSVAQAGIKKGMGMKNDDALCLPLCAMHHVGDEGIHRGVLTWEARYGTQVWMLEQVAARLGPVPVPVKPERRRSKLLKVLPRRGVK